MSLENNPNIQHKANGINYSVMKLYNSAFPIVFPLFLIFIALHFFNDFDLQNAYLVGGVAFAALFFKLSNKSKFVIEHQLAFHQCFVILSVLGTIFTFIIYPEQETLLYMLFFGNTCSYLLITNKVTVAYVIIFNLFLLLLVTNYPILSYKIVLYSAIYSFCSIFVSKWLNGLIINSQKLKVAEKKYRLLFEDGNGPIILFKNENGLPKIIDANARAKQIFTRNSEEKLIGHSFEKLVDECEYEHFNNTKIHLENLAPNNQLVVKCRLKRLDHSIFDAEISFVKILLDNDDILFQVLVNDITNKKQYENELNELIQSFKNIVENSPACIFIFTDEELVYKNVHAEQLYYEKLNNSETNLFRIFPDKHQYLLDELLREIGNKTSSYTEISLGKEDKKNYSISLVNVVYKGKKSVLMRITDITLQNEYNIQRIRAEVAEETNKRLFEEIEKHHETQADLLEKTSKLNALFESSSNLFILTIDRDLRISSFNSSFKKMMQEHLGVEAGIGDDFLNTFPIEEYAYPKLIKKFKRALRGESVEIISHFPAKTGQVWMESFISPIHVKGQAIKEIAFIAHDITEKLENEKRVLLSEANNKATVSAIPDMLFKVSKEGYFTDFRLNEQGQELIEKFGATTDLKNKHIYTVFGRTALSQSFLRNIQKALRTGEVHTQNYIIPFVIGKSDNKLFYENRYSRVNEEEVIIITRDVTDNVEFETRLIESVREKEVLLKEVHHRVKNNLQVISSILNLQSSYVEDEKTLEIINESQNRIRSMSYIHESLYQTKDFSSIDFDDYITNLVKNLVHSYQVYSGKTKLKLDIAHVTLALDQAIPCGLILNELVSNSLKYAYPDGGEGEIQIEIKEESGKIKIRVEDFGVGLPQGFKIEESESLGLGLVDTLIDQLDGELILKTDRGTKYLIIFDKQDL